MPIRGIPSYLPSERVSPQNPLQNQERPKQDTAFSASRVITANPGNMLEISADTGSAISGWTLQDSDSPQGNDVPVGGMFWPVCESGEVFFTAGTGSIRVREWTWEMGAIRAASGGMTSGASGNNPKANPSKSVAGTGNVVAPAAGGQVLGGVLAVAGATAPCYVEISGDQANVAVISIADTQAVAAALAGMPIYAAGIDGWSVPVGGKLFAASAAGTMTYYVRVST